MLAMPAVEHCFRASVSMKMRLKTDLSLSPRLPFQLQTDESKRQYFPLQVFGLDINWLTKNLSYTLIY